MKTSAELRQAFLTFFKDKGHEVVPSSSLVPGNDPTLLFTNAGMVQFKDVFLGRDKRAYTRATSSQRCVRAGGKHNDLENVGYTARHHTFFEMLGNFSFGDYFKQDAIKYAWEFLTEVVGLPADKLWVTVYADDDEAADIWLNNIGVSADRFSRIGDKPGKKYESDNFWAMGDTGPCGPCTEIFYDHGEDIWGGPPGTPEEDGDRYIEIWNLVFMQYNRSADGEMDKLPAPSVDTGMGLERLAAILQGVHNNYDIDIFQHLIRAAANETRTTDLDNKSLRVIADHIRSCAFLCVDGVLPSNEGRGYVLRRIIRRACRHGHQLGMDDLFFYKLVQPLVEIMGEAYPELADAQSTVERLLRMEEERFAETLDHGMKILEEDIKQLQDKTITGETLFKLYDTYGFPVDLTADIARERGLEIDEAGFEACMEAQRERGRSASQFGVDYNKDVQVECESVFTGYDQLKQDATVLELFVGADPVDSLAEGQQGIIVLDETPFYGESGGQVGDTGLLSSSAASFIVKDTQKQGNSVLHIGEVQKGSISKGDQLTAEFDLEARKAISRNHSATHLMHAALQQVLGDHVSQKGSLVDAEKLRFDFSHFEPVTNEQLKQIEQIVNAQIRGNSEASAKEMALEAAKASGAMALFGEKYDDVVRVVSMGEPLGDGRFSTELCGGVHVSRVGDIGFFKITAETGIASGVRRIEAVTGEAAVNWVEAKDSQLDSLARLLKSSRDEVNAKVEQLIQKLKEQDKQLAQLKGKMASQAGSDLSSQAEDIGGVKILTAHLDGADSNTLRDTLDQLKNKLGSAAIVLASSDDGKVKLIAGVTKELSKTIKAGDLVNIAAAEVGGKGGGRPDMAQAGGSKPEAIPQALAAAKSWLQQQL
ncbi:MAG: alanine--tRNA ligase [Gammaproteobacteria bacterium]|jgi:alanyl-tRNA synthetase|nr:alanine--tRNA ligase [Gammaproteobacteria bacterium]